MFAVGLDSSAKTFVAAPVPKLPAPAGTIEVTTIRHLGGQSTGIADVLVTRFLSLSFLPAQPFVQCLPDINSERSNSAMAPRSSVPRVRQCDWGLDDIAKSAGSVYVV